MQRYIGIHLLIPAIVYHVSVTSAALEYYGRYIGPLKSYHHGVTGDVYAVDARTLHIRDFNYDGEGPAAYFYVGNTKSVNGNGFRILDEKGTPNPLKRYRRKHVTLTLPEGRTLNNIKWFSVWCDEASISFADIKIPKNPDYPKPQKISPLSGVHAVSSDPIVVVDAQTLLIPSFSYDGEAPDAKFWVGRGTKPSPQGVRVPDENGKELPLRRYDRKTIVLTLPGDLTIFDIGHFGVWCEAFTVDFGHIQIPRGLNVPPSLKMLGVSPQSKLNCEVLHEELAFEVRWAVAGDSIVVQLVAKLEDGEYMSFGLSGDDRHNVMIGGDVAVAWVDHETLNGYAVDYYLDDKSQCAGNRGSCPDYRIQDNTNSVRLLNAALVNGYSIVTYQRPVRAHDILDKPVYTNTSQAVIWAVGPLNSKQEVSYHKITSKGDLLLNFGRTPRWNCPIPESDAAVGASNDEEEEIEAPVHSSLSPSAAVDQYKTPPPPPAAAKHSGAWDIPPIQCNEPEDGVFYAQMGPTGGTRGYSAITKHVGWGIAFYVNGLLIPEIHVVRGKTYTFVVEGGLDPEIPAKFHPFYITDDPVGGYEHKTPEERAKVKIYAGVERTKRGEIVPTGTGRLCNWTPDPEQPPADEFASFGAYQRTLTLVCDHGEPGVITWTPDEDTPDVVYYQCFSHRYLGWKIHVHDTCDLPHVHAASATVESRVKYDETSADDQEEELESRPSIRVTTRVRPDGQQILGGYHAQNIEISPKPKDAYSEYNKNFYVTPIDTHDIHNQTHSTTETLPTQRLTVINSQYVNTNNKIKIPVDTMRSVIPVSEEVREALASTLSDEKLKPYENMQMTTPNDDLKNESESKPVIVKHKVPAATGVHRNNMAHGRPVIRRPISSMSIIRPQFRRPPQHTVMMASPMHRPVAILSSATQNRPIIVKKPIYRFPIGAMARPVMIHNPYHPPPSVLVPSQIPVNHPQIMKSVSVSYSASKGKGKPIPLAMIKPDRYENRKETIQPSKFISHITEESKPSIPLAVNTGFNPGSLVIEGGFKPIIQNTAEAQDRISEVEDGYDDNTEGTVRLYAEDDSQSESLLNQQTQMFEPMFIPSPPDSVHKHIKKPTGYELETNLQKKKNYYRKPIRQSMIIIRRRPVTASFRSQQDDTQDETAMAAERMDTYYLPPSGPVYGLSQNGGQVEVPVSNDDGVATIVTYDGKPVSDSDLVPPIPRTQTQKFGNYNSKGSSDLLKNTPQFGPYRGEIPPPVPEDVKPENIPQLRLRSNNPPPHSLALELRPDPEGSPISRTRLTFIRPVEEVESKDELISEESEIKETQVPFKIKQKVSSDWEKQKEIPKKVISHNTYNSTSTPNKKEETELGKVMDTVSVVDRDEKSLRQKRSAHHEPGHVDDHDMHEHHDHDMKPMQNMSIPTNSAVTQVSNVLLPVVISAFVLIKCV